MYIPIPISDDELSRLILDGPHKIGAGVYALAKELQRARNDQYALIRTIYDAVKQERIRCCMIAANYIVDGNSIHPDIPADRMRPDAKMIAHTTCQHIADAIMGDDDLEPEDRTVASEPPVA